MSLFGDRRLLKQFFYRAPFFPLAVLIGQMVLLWTLNDPTQMSAQHQPDTGSYLQFDQQSLTEALGYSRTLLYPMLVSFGSFLFGSMDWIPPFHHLLQMGAVLMFWYGLVRFGFNPWSAMIVASPLLYSEMLRYFGSSIQTDAPGVSLAVCTMGSLLLALSSPSSRRAWALWAIFLFLAYQMRPANLFLVPLSLLLGMIFWYLRLSSAKRQDDPDTRGILKRLLIFAVLPLLVFSFVRWVTVGHFGLVSFGGSVAIGIAAPLIAPPTLQKLPEHLRPLAEAIRNERQKHNLTPPFNNLGWIRYGPWVNEYNTNVNTIAIPLALGLTHNNFVASNALLTELCLEVFRLRPEAYLQWILSSAADAVGILMRHQRATQILLALLLPLCVFHLFLRGLRRARYPEASHPIPAWDLSWEVAVLGTLSLLYFLSGTLLVILVDPPIERYMFASAHLLPSLAALLIPVCLGGVMTLLKTPGSGERSEADVPGVSDSTPPARDGFSEIPKQGV